MNNYEHFENLVHGGFTLKTKLPEQLSLSGFFKILEYQKDPSIIVPLIIDGIMLEYVICEPWGYNYNEKVFYYRIKFTDYPSSCWYDTILDLRANTDKYYLEPVIENTPNIFRIEYMVLRKEKNHDERQEYQMFNIHVPENIKLKDIEQAIMDDERFTDRAVLIPAHEKYCMNQSLNDLRMSTIDRGSVIGVFERVDFKNDHAELCVKMIDTSSNTELIKSMNGKCCKAYPRLMGHRKEDGSIEIRKIITFDIVYE